LHAGPVQYEQKMHRDGEAALRAGAAKVSVIIADKSDTAGGYAVD
jgi:hypothetical protein